MTICYLDVDDEITNAVARLRAAPDLRVLLVLPPGSRIATSRINFRLLAREAREHQRRLSIVSGEAGVRQVAASAGLAAYGSVAEFERALEEARAAAPDDADDLDQAAGSDGAGRAPGRDLSGEPPAPTAAEDAALTDDGFEGGVAALGAASVGSGLSVSELSSRSTAVAPTPPTPEAGTATRRELEAQRGEREAQRREAERRSRAEAWPRGPEETADDVRWRDDRSIEATAVRPRERPAAAGGRRTLVAVGLAVLALLLVLGSVAGYLLLPRADITITPTGERAGPVSLTVRADPEAEAADPTAGVVPATAVQIPLSVDGEFPATGIEVTTTRATGSVRFSNYDFTSEVSLPAGSIVSTDSGIRFATQDAATVPPGRLILPGRTIEPGRADVGVRAVEGGPAGNVAANAIDNVPEGQDPDSLTVTNPQPTTGGSRTETLFVQQRDYDGAVAALSARLDGALATALADPATTPAGLRLFPETAVRGRPTADPAPAELVRQKVERFTLSLSATAAATAVDETQLDGLATERLRSTVPDGWQLFEDSVRGRHEAGEVDGRTVVYRVEAAGEQWRPVDGERLLEEVKGLPVADAQARLQEHGKVTIATWPDWVDSIPTLDARLSLTVAPPERLSP
jgi:hypothetical protein